MASSKLHEPFLLSCFVNAYLYALNAGTCAHERLSVEIL
jgi:hypothetical protein